jgi:hypothetical protein
MGKILLVIGATVGGVILGLGILGLLVTLTDNTLSASDRNDQVTGAIVIMAVGLTVFAPCLFFAVRSESRSTMAQLSQGAAYGSGFPGVTTPYAPVDLSGSYLQWFGWCQREVGGNAISLHAATMAAMAEAGAGNSSGAAGRAKQAVSRASLLLAAQAQAVTTPTGKIRQLARIGSATLPLLEPGENVVVSFYGTDRQAQIWQSMFGIIGMLIAMSQQGAYYVTVTDRRVIALTGPQLGRTPSTLAFAVPRSMVAEARFRAGLLGGGTFNLRRMDGGRTRIRLTRYWKREGAAAQESLVPGVGLTPLPPPPIVASSSNF